MWNILGEDALYIDIAEKMKEMTCRYAGDDDRADKFRSFMNNTEVLFLLNGQKRVGLSQL